MDRLGHGPHKLGDLGRIGGHLNRLGIDMSHAQHPPGVAPLVWKNQGDHVAGTAGPGCAARTVQEGLGISWWIHLDYQVHISDIHTASSHIGSH